MSAQLLFTIRLQKKQIADLANVIKNDREYISQLEELIMSATKIDKEQKNHIDLLIEQYKLLEERQALVMELIKQPCSN